ncbi:ATP-dependent RNA helicase DBP7 [Tirmania nivea]|nr:ATP-dependent RNA helicase DBP7 [Tirmania nivea]
MADDGLLMNFDDAAAAAAPVPAYRGGRWTDRVRAKRAARCWEKKQRQLAAAGTQRSQAEERGAAREAGALAGGGGGGGSKRKGDGGAAGGGGGDSRPAQRRRSGGAGGAGGKRQSGGSSSQNPPAPEKAQFISSLWTGNPAAPAAAATAPEADAEQAPTNAPLSGGSATFAALGLSTPLAAHLAAKLLLEAPTAVQKAAIPELLSADADAFIQAQTGSGKTLAYLLPILDRIQSLSAVGGRRPDRSSGLFALVLAPTRELAAQISGVLAQLTGAPSLHWITPTCVTGGEKRKSEKARLRKGCNILVATPGRLLDHLETTESLDVAHVRWMVMDEGDRLADQGFEQEIAKIVEIVGARSRLSGSGEGRLPTRRVTVLCSATMGAGVQRLGDISLTEASFIKPDPTGTPPPPANSAAPSAGGETFLAPAQLRQSYILVPPKQRYVALYAVLKRAFLRAPPNMKVIVFFSCADSVDFHFEAFSRSLDEQEQTGQDRDTNKGRNNKTPPPPKLPLHPAIRPAPLLHDSLVLCKLHGSLPQAQRTESLKSFTAGHPTLLFSTDVSSRGLDLPNVDLVIQFDPPFSRADYLHRIGRTARAGRPGRAVIFLLAGTGEEAYVAQVMARTSLSGARIRETPLSEVLEKGFSSSSSSTAGWQERATSLQLTLEEQVARSPAHLALARRAWASHVRAYATHGAAERHMFDVRTVHTGHLAKGFGLRERPAEISSRRGRADAEGARVARARPDAEDQVARHKMLRMAGMLQRRGMASEFNIA